MTGQDKLIGLLKADPASLECETKFQEMKKLYADEFGITWIMNELSTATKVISKAAYRGIADVVLAILKKADKHETTQMFIGTKMVTPEQFCYYSKGLFWMAGYILLNPAKKLIG